MKYDFSKLFIQYWLWSLIFETFILASYFVARRTFPSRTIFDAYASNNAQLMIRFNRCLTLKNEWRVAHSIRIMLMWRIVRLISKLWRKAFTPQMLWLLASFDLNNIRAMIKKMSSYQYRKSHRLISTMGFPLRVRCHLCIEPGTISMVLLVLQWRYGGFFYTWFDKKDFDESLWRYYWLTDM